MKPNVTQVNARMHQCEFCDYKTIRKDNMQKHVDNMHEMEGEDYDCEKCDFVTRRKGKLKTHMIKVRDAYETTKMRHESSQLTLITQCLVVGFIET